MTPSRRDLLERVGAMATVAGATSVGLTARSGTRVASETEPSTPAFHRWLALEDDSLEFTYVNWEALGASVQAELEAGDDEEVPEEYEDDPMIAPVSEGVLSAYLFVGLSLVPYRLATMLEEGAFESTVEELLQTADAFVVAGSIEPAAIDAELTAEPASDIFVQFEQTDEIGAYDLYNPVESADTTAIAVGTDALVIATDEETQDPPSVAERTIDTATGDRERAVEASESFDWLLETAGRGDVAVGEYGGPFDSEALRHPSLEAVAAGEGYVSSFTAEDTETGVGTFAAIMPDPDVDELEETLGVSADERTIDVDGERVTATGTWDEPQ